jgi:hypothetical protein
MDRQLPTIARARVDVAHLGDVRQVETLNLCTRLPHQKKVDSLRLTLSDSEGEGRIRTLPIVIPALIDRMQDIAMTGPVDVLGFTIARQNGLRGAKGEYLFYALAARRPQTPFEILRASSQEETSTRKKLEGMIKAGFTPLEYIRSELRRLLGFRGEKVATQLARALDIMVLQALSEGQIHNCNGRVHSLIVGPPAAGKKLCNRAAEVLNPIYNEMGHKFTVAGLVGHSARTSGGWTTRPGLLPKSHGGTAALQDAHALTKGKNQQMLGILAGVMEDGQVPNSASGGRMLDAETAMHLDFNRARDLELTTGNKDKDLAKLPSNIISRLDAIVEIERDSDRQRKVATEMAGSVTMVGGTRGAIWKEERELKLLVALLRQEFAEIRPTPSARDRAARGLDDLLARASPDAQALVGMSATRMANSLWKIAAAHARGHARPDATEEDVDRALEVLRLRLDFLERWAGATERAAQADRSEPERRRAAVARRLHGATVDVEDYREAAAEEGFQISTSTAYRDVKVLKKDGEVERPHGQIIFHSGAEPDDEETDTGNSVPAAIEGGAGETLVLPPGRG